MTTSIEVLLEARTAHQRNDWHTSYSAFVRADGLGPMPTSDIEAYSAAAWRLGRGGEAARLAERAYDQLVRTDATAAAMKAIDLSLVWRTRGHHAVAADWAAKARLLLAGTPMSAAHGYLAYVDGVAAIDRNDDEALADAIRTLREAATQTGDPVLTVLQRVIGGVAAVLGGRDADGLAILDSVLLPVVDPRVPLEWGGDAYRLALWSGERRGDDDHVRTWVGSMQQWCDTVDSDAYRAICAVHRIRVDVDRGGRAAQVLRLQRAVVDVDAAAAAMLQELLPAAQRSDHA